MHSPTLSRSILVTLIAVLGCCPAFSAPKQKPSGGDSDVRWGTDFDAAVKLAKKTKRDLLVDFFATWCGPCKMLDKTTYKDPQVKKFLSKFVLVKLDVDIPKNRLVVRYYEASSLPSVGIITAAGKFKGGFVGYRPPEEFVGTLMPFLQNKS